MSESNPSLRRAVDGGPAKDQKPVETACDPVRGVQCRGFESWDTFGSGDPTRVIQTKSQTMDIGALWFSAPLYFTVDRPSAYETDTLKRRIGNSKGDVSPNGILRKTETWRLAELARKLAEYLESDFCRKLIRDGYTQTIEVRGYASHEGNDSYNEALSLRRAEMVCEWCRTFLVDRKLDRLFVKEPDAPLPFDCVWARSCGVYANDDGSRPADFEPPNWLHRRVKLFVRTSAVSSPQDCVVICCDLHKENATVVSAHNWKMGTAEGMPMFVQCFRDLDDNVRAIVKTQWAELYRRVEGRPDASARVREMLLEFGNAIGCRLNPGALGTSY